ncbi:MAG: PspA/IM30 family protein, partial [Betaproteobacteria bacterium]|nr:PspA/IM30 family protein [Betaproteobacteria bacterium]
MAETLKTRVSHIIAGSVHALLDRIENQAPEAMMEQAIREIDSVIQDVRHELGLASANRHLAQQQHANLNKQHETLIDQIDHALTQSREELARAAVARQLDIEAQIPILETTLSEYARQENELQGYIAALLAKKREMTDAVSDFRKSRAQAAASTLPGQPVGGALDQRIETATHTFERIFERHTGLSGTARNASLHQAARLKELDDLVRE